MQQQTHHHGNDGWEKLRIYLNSHTSDNLLLITGAEMWTTSGAEARMRSMLSQRNVRHIRGVEINPKAEELVSILSEIENLNAYDLILAIGGGSVIDIAKLIKAFGASKDPIYGYLNGNESLVPHDVPLVAIPSTAGSGSEATHFAVVYCNKDKHSIAHERLLPDCAITIPSLLKSLSSNVAAASGMDALCQGIESYWSIHSTDESRAIAAKAITLAWNSIEQVVLNKDPKALSDMAKAAHLAGQAINITKTTAPHAVSYALTSFFGIQHGHAVGILVPEFMQYNMAVSDHDCLDPRGSTWIHNSIDQIGVLLGCDKVTDAVIAIRNLMKKIGLEVNLSCVGIESREQIKVIMENGFNSDRLHNNPRKISHSDLSYILNQCR